MPTSESRAALKPRRAKLVLRYTQSWYVCPACGSDDFSYTHFNSSSSAGTVDDGGRKYVLPGQRVTCGCGQKLVIPGSAR